MFQLTQEEWESLKSQFVIAKTGRGGSRFLPYASTGFAPACGGATSEVGQRAIPHSPEGFRFASLATSLNARRGALPSIEWHVPHGTDVLFRCLPLCKQACNGQSTKKHRSWRCDAIPFCGE